MEGAREDQWVKAVAATIKAERAAHGMSQGALAGKIGLDRQTVSNWEIGKREPNLGALARVAWAFEMELGEFMDRAKQRLK